VGAVAAEEAGAGSSDDVVGAKAPTRSG